MNLLSNMNSELDITKSYFNTNIIVGAFVVAYTGKYLLMSEQNAI